MRPTITDSVKSISDLIYYSRRHLPSAPDGLTAAQAAPASAEKPQDHGLLFTFIDDIQEQIKRGLPIDTSEQTLVAFVDGIKHANTTGIDDRNLLLEKVLTLLSRLPPDSVIQSKLTDAVINLLYSDLPHPPATLLGKKHAFRSADGSFNNIVVPDMGKARMPYARSVQSKHPIPYTSLPDPDLVFDSLLKRDGTAPHPSGISSLLFSFANIIIHSLFKTDEKYKHINNTSSYLDLSPLYGTSEAEQKSVRLFDGRGLLYNDTFADQRMFLMPPATAAVLIIFARNHNYIASRLFQINERRTYVDPPPSDDPAALMTQDDDIFNRARLINCGHFTNVILSDYIGAILGLTIEGSDWTLNPLTSIRESDHSLVGRGEGNINAVEFNLLYRWHATISIPDEKWTEDMFRKTFPEVNSQSITPTEYTERIKSLRMGPSASYHGTNPNPSREAQLASNSARGFVRGSMDGDGTVQEVWTTNGLAQPPDADSGSADDSSSKPSGPNTWRFAGLNRDPVTGKFPDAALADILHNATETAAQAFRARGTPEVMRIVEVMGIEQARQWGVCTLNEFRSFLGLKAYTSFEEWNPDPEIARAAEVLYGHIDNLELYPGMQAEEAKVPGPGAGLCPGYTISRAILADAVALTRGDRFLTTDLTPYNLTSWGFQDCSRESDNGAFGSGMAKLLFRALPNNYSYNSVYSLFAFYTPGTASTILHKLKISEKYDFDRPKMTKEVKPTNTWQGLTQVLRDSRGFKVTYEAATKALTNDYGFYLASDEHSKHEQDRKLLRDALFPDASAMKRYATWYGKKTAELINEKSYSIVGKSTRSVDIVRDVVNLVPVHWVSTQIAGLPLKTTATPHGVHTEQEIYRYLSVVYSYVFLNTESEGGWKRKAEAEKAAAVLQRYTKTQLDAMRGPHLIGLLTESVIDWLNPKPDESRPFLKRLAASGRPTDVLTYNVFGFISVVVAKFATAAALVVNFYLDDARAAERAEVIRLVDRDTPEENRELLGYILEALRLDPQASGIFREAAVDIEVKEGQGLPSFRVKKGQTVFASVRNANIDPVVFGPDPDAIDPNRPIENYPLFGEGSHSDLGYRFVQGIMPEVMRRIFKLKNLRRAPGASGKLNRFENTLYGTTRSWLYIDGKGSVSPFPASMLVQYDL